ncbi:MAG: hypothetical protein AB1486_32640 [Planctomycetota bacterium]
MTTTRRDEVHVHCRRLGRLLSAQDHKDCPYCFGRTAEITSTVHEAFCDWDPKRDPINFGFPETHGRQAGG